MTGPILYLTGEYPRATDTFIQREVAALRRRGLEVHTATIRRTDPAQHTAAEIRAEAARTFAVLARAANPLALLADHLSCAVHAPLRYAQALVLAAQTRPPGWRGAARQLAYFAEAGVLAAHMRRQRIAHVHNHFAHGSATVAMLAARMCGAGFSLTVHGPDDLYDPAHWRLDAKARQARFVACISHFARARVAEAIDPADHAKLAVVRCGLDLSEFTPAEAPPAPPLRLVFVGRLAPVKGLPVLIDALAQAGDALGDWRLEIVGDGPERAAITRRIAEAGLAARITIAGFTPPAEVRARILAAHALVLPSFAEGVPVVLMEAMACGRPVVATRIAGIPELVADGTSGCLVPPGDADALAAAIGRLADPALRARMGKAGRARVAEEFDIAQSAERLATLFAAARHAPAKAAAATAHGPARGTTP